MAVAARELEQAQKTYRVQDRKRSAGKQTSARRRKGYKCGVAEGEQALPTLAQTALPLPSTDQYPNHITLWKPEAPTPDTDEIKNDALRAYHRKQAELESAKSEPKHTLLLIKEQVEANNRRGYPYISLEDAYAGYMMWLKQEEEEELEEWWERREHEAEMRLRQDEARRAAIRQETIQAEQQKTSYPSFPMGRWHECEDDLDDDWW